MTFKIFTCRQTIQAARRTGEKAKDIDNRRNFIIERTMQRFATITGLQFVMRRAINALYLVR